MFVDIIGVFFVYSCLNIIYCFLWFVCVIIVQGDDAKYGYGYYVISSDIWIMIRIGCVFEFEWIWDIMFWSFVNFFRVY